MATTLALAAINCGTAAAFIHAAAAAVLPAAASISVAAMIAASFPTLLATGTAIFVQKQNSMVEARVLNAIAGRIDVP